MQKILKVARREYIETIKTKTFIFGVLMTPVIIGGIIFFTFLISRDKGGPRPPMKVAVTDLSEELSAEIKTSFDKHNDSNPGRQILLQELQPQENSAADTEGKSQLRQGRIDAYVAIDKDILAGAGKIHLYTFKLKATNIDVLGTIENLFNRAIVNQRCKIRNLSPELLAELRNVPIEHVEVGATDDAQRIESESQRIVKFMVPFFFMYFIFMGIVGMGQHMLSSIIEEKNSRVIEVLLSALSPFQLMGGKILGLAGIGLTVTSLWAVAAYLAVLWLGLNIDIT
ncbi:MAG: ABC transporter permease, partial [Planctomycetota bacterium]|nr:ABC transporter permease [Planctomycetota bacterium]